MKTVLITGAFGFAGANLTKCMAGQGYRVIALGRKDSPHNTRCAQLPGVFSVYADMEDYGKLPEILKEARAPLPDALIHLAWGGGRRDYDAQLKNVKASLALMDAAAAIGVRRFIGIGSQAEYGIKNEIITEDLLPEPIEPYGACKAAAFYLLGSKAKTLGMEFIWGRIFSLIGEYEPRGRMLPELYMRLKAGDDMKLSSCEQYWDYLDAFDAAQAITGLLEKGKNGEVYNICSGDYRPLKEFTERILDLLDADRGLIHYGEKAEPFVSLKSSCEKLKKDIGWKPTTSFEDSVKKYDMI